MNFDSTCDDNQSPRGKNVDDDDDDSSGNPTHPLVDAMKKDSSDDSSDSSSSSDSNGKNDDDQDATPSHPEKQNDDETIGDEGQKDDDVTTIPLLEENAVTRESQSSARDEEFEASHGANHDDLALRIDENMIITLENLVDVSLRVSSGSTQDVNLGVISLLSNIKILF